MPTILKTFIWKKLLSSFSFRLIYISAVYNIKNTTNRIDLIIHCLMKSLNLKYNSITPHVRLRSTLWTAFDALTSANYFKHYIYKIHYHELIIYGQLLTSRKRMHIFLDYDIFAAIYSLFFIFIMLRWSKYFYMQTSNIIFMWQSVVNDKN